MRHGRGHALSRAAPSARACVTIGQRSKGDRPTEDRIVIVRDAVIVLDGVTTLDDAEPQGGWYADTLGYHIADRLTRYDADLRETVHAAIAVVVNDHDLKPGASPAAPVAVLRWTSARVKALALGDSNVVVTGATGARSPVRDDRLAGLITPHPLQVVLQDRLRRGCGFDDRHQELRRALRDHQNTHLNRPGGYWIAEASPEAAEHAIVQRWDQSSLIDAVVMTDGVSVGVDEYGLYPSYQPLALVGGDWNGYARGGPIPTSEGLQRLLRHLKVIRCKGRADTLRVNYDVDDTLDRAGLVDIAPHLAAAHRIPPALTATAAEGGARIDRIYCTPVLADAVESYRHFEIGSDHVGLHFEVNLDTLAASTVAA